MKVFKSYNNSKKVKIINFVPSVHKNQYFNKITYLVLLNKIGLDQIFI